RLHRRLLIKYAAPLVVATLAPAYHGPLQNLPSTPAHRGDGLSVLTAGVDGHAAHLVRLPLLMRIVTTVIPVFRRWPTSYRWRGMVTLGQEPTLRSGWQRTGTGGAETYQRRTRG